MLVAWTVYGRTESHRYDNMQTKKNLYGNNNVDIENEGFLE